MLITERESQQCKKIINVCYYIYDYAGIDKIL